MDLFDLFIIFHHFPSFCILSNGQVPLLGATQPTHRLGLNVLGAKVVVPGELLGLDEAAALVILGAAAWRMAIFLVIFLVFLLSCLGKLLGNIQQHPT